MKVLLINPSWRRHTKISSLWRAPVSRNGSRHHRAWPPTDLVNCAALLQQEGIEVKLLDARAHNIHPLEIAKEAEACDKVFVTTSPLDRWQCPNLVLDLLLENLSTVRNTSALYLMGAHGTHYPEWLLARSGARAVIHGEPEIPVLAICRSAPLASVPGITYRDGERFRTTPPPPPLDLRTLPPLPLHLLDFSAYRYELLGDRMMLFETSRGCPFPCTFCHKTVYGEKFRSKTPEQVFEEIRAAVTRHGVKSGYFIDLEFLVNAPLVRRLCDLLIEAKLPFTWGCQTRAGSVSDELLAKMRQGGCALIHFGIDSGSDRVLSAIHKKTSRDEIKRGVSMAKAAGIQVAGFFMFGFPGENQQEMEETIRFAAELDPTYASFHIVTPYPGTPLFSAHPRAGRDQPGAAENLFPEHFSSHHDLRVLKKMRRKAFLSFYLRPVYFWNRLKCGNSSLLKNQIALFLGHLFS